MRKSRVGVRRETAVRSWSRREVLATSARVASVLALPGLWIPKAWGAQGPFDYFVSTTGNDSNAGTLAQPWALTSFIQGSANNNRMAGKRIGIIAGSYTITSAFPERSDYQYCKLNLPAGTSSNPTYVASCDTSGNYSPRAATITWGGGSTTTNGLMGNGDAGGGYITIDGLRINGNGVAATSVGGGHIIQFYGNTSGNYRLSAMYAQAPGVVVQNCELFNINPQQGGSYLGGNYAAVAFIAVSAPICQNNLIHDVIYTGSDNNAASHQAGCLDLGCPNSHYLNNTIYNCSSGIWVKEGSTGTIAAYNYIYSCATNSTAQAGYCSAFIGFDGQGGNPNPGPAPTYQQIHHNVVDACGATHKFVENWPQNSTIAVRAFNNTVYETSSNGLIGWDMAVTGDTAQFYNNIHVNAAGGTGATGAMYNGKLNVSSGQFSPVDNNCYYANSGNYSSWWQLVGNGSSSPTFSSLGAWQSASGADTHSIAANPNFSFSGGYGAGRGANQFQLAAGSPCLGTGRGGVNMGAWDGSTTQVGCNFAPGSTGSAAATPDAPQLTVS